MLCYVAEVTCATNSAGDTTVLYFSSHGRPPTKPTDTPANTVFEPRMKQPTLMRREIYTGSANGGQGAMGYGDLILVNNDGGLDYLKDYGFDGRQLKLLVGEESGAYPSEYTTIFVGTMLFADFSNTSVTLKIRDRIQELLIKPIQETKYAGSNVLPDGLEGVEEDLKGKPKPRTYGKVYNVSPPCVNTSRLIYQVNDGAINDVSAVYDRGALLTQETDYISQTDMETNAPSASSYRVWPAGGYFRLGSSPDGLITADVIEGSAAANRTVGQITKGILENVAGLSTSEYSTTDITNLDTANSAEVGIWIAEEMNINDALNVLAGSIGAWYTFDKSGVFRIKQLVVPSGTSVTTFDENSIISATIQNSSNLASKVPTYQINLSYYRNYTQQASDIASVVTDSRMNFLKEIYRKVIATDNTVKNKHLLSEEMEVETLLIDSTAAQTEATRLLGIYKVMRDRLEVDVYLEGCSCVLDLGELVDVQWGRFGLSLGKQFMIIGYEPNFRTGKAKLILWG